jgi:hypothetical protein
MVTAKPLDSPLGEEPPSVHAGDMSSHLHFRKTISSLDLFLERNRGLSFLIIKEHYCCGREFRYMSNGVPSPQQEKLMLVSQDLCDVLSEFRDKHEDRGPLIPEFAVLTEIDNPHLWAYHTERELSMHLDRCRGDKSEHLRLFLEYFNTDKRHEWAEVGDQLSKNLISRNYVQYVFVRTFALS